MRYQTPIDQSAIRSLIPHYGNMCLLQTVLACSDDSITCATLTHTDPANPLARDGGLPITAGIEYAAQAMALHAALTAPTSSEQPIRPMLTQLQDVRWESGPLSAQPALLTVDVTRTAQLGNAASYAFRLTSAERTLLEGNALVVRV